MLRPIIKKDKMYEPVRNFSRKTETTAMSLKEMLKLKEKKTVTEINLFNILTGKLDTDE